MAAVQIDGAERLVAVGGRVCRRHRIGVDRGVAVVLVLVVTDVRRASLGLVLAVRRHGRPAELERHQGEQDDGEEATHGPESSGYMGKASIGKATALWCFTASRA